MIDINLIPATLRKNSKGSAGSLNINIPKEILLGIGSGLVVLFVAVHLILSVVWLISFAHLSVCQSQWQKLAADKATLDAIKNEGREIKNKSIMISDITVKKSVLWAPKFNAISDSLPRGLWIRKMTLDKTGLSIEGSVVSKTQNEINNVGLFLATLKQDNNFIKDFLSLEVNSIQRSKENAIDVTDFIVMAKLK